MKQKKTAKEVAGEAKSRKLFYFSEKDEYLITVAKERAKRFMEKYGKGEKLHMVDLRYYIK